MKMMSSDLTLCWFEQHSLQLKLRSERPLMAGHSYFKFCSALYTDLKLMWGRARTSLPCSSSDTISGWYSRLKLTYNSSTLFFDTTSTRQLYSLEYQSLWPPFDFSVYFYCSLLRHLLLFSKFSFSSQAKYSSKNML